jgi:hypothetical protein
VTIESRTQGSGSIGIWLKRDAGRRASFYLLGHGAIRTKDDSDRLAQIIEAHCGNSERPACVSHLGSMQMGVRLGDETVHGAAEAQRRRLTAFFSTVLPELGGYGSWWLASFALVQQTLNLTFTAYPTELVLLQDVAARAPWEWREDAFARWVAERAAKWGGEGDRLTLVGRESVLTPFIAAPYARTMPLDEWFKMAAGRTGAARKAARVTVESSSGRLAQPRLYAATATILLSAERMCVIEIKPPPHDWPLELHVADFATDDKDLSVDLQWL